MEFLVQLHLVKHVHVVTNLLRLLEEVLKNHVENRVENRVENHVNQYSH